jgi:hypothetical protein
MQGGRKGVAGRKEVEEGSEGRKWMKGVKEGRKEVKKGRKEVKDVRADQRRKGKMIQEGRKGEMTTEGKRDRIKEGRKEGKKCQGKKGGRIEDGAERKEARKEEGTEVRKEGMDNDTHRIKAGRETALKSMGGEEEEEAPPPSALMIRLEVDELFSLGEPEEDEGRKGKM